MKRFTFFLLLTVVTGITLADDWVEVTFSNRAKGISFRSVCIKKSDPGMTLFPKSFVVTFSDAPKGSGEGYYAAHAGDGYVIDGEKKNKISIEDERMKPRGDGWYIYTFEKPLYIHSVGTLVGSEVPPIYILPISSDEGQSATDSDSKDELPSESETNTISDSDNTKNAEEEQIPPLKMLTPRHTLVDEGWTLAKTTKENNQTCEIYVKEIDDEEDSLFTYRKGDGEFITYKKGIYKNEVVGDYKWTRSKGEMELCQSGARQIVYPSGVVISYDMKDKEKETLYLPENPEKGYRAPDNYIIDGEQFNPKTEPNGEGGFLIGDRICYLDDDGRIVPYRQECKGRFFPINPSDTIIDVKYEKKDTVRENHDVRKYITEVFYKNGDYYKCVEVYEGGYEIEGYAVANMHRLGGILKLKKNKKPVVTREDNTTIEIDAAFNSFIIEKGRKKIDRGDGIGQFSILNRGAYMSLWLLKEDPVLWNGTMTYPDGTTEKYIEGVSQNYLKKKREDAKAAELAEKRAPYIKKYGFYPGDYKRAQEAIKVGRPFGAIEEFYICKLVRDNGTAKQYKVLILNSLTNDNLNITAYVWVQNGKITSVRW